MIKIDEAKKEILFVPDDTQGEHPPARSFLLLSGYVCPFCRKILAAYFQGRMSEAEIEYYERQKPRYKIGTATGGHYIKLENHQGYSYGSCEDRCSWEEFAGRGIVRNLRLFVERYELPKMLIQALSENIHSIPGFCVVEDVCSKDKEILLFSEDELFGELKRKDFDGYWKARNELGRYLARLIKEMGGDQDTRKSERK